MIKIKLIIPSEFPTQNEIVKVSKSHYMAYANMKKDYTALTMIYAQKLPKIKHKIDLEFTWHRKNRRSDPDNIAGGIKFILDGMVKAGAIQNDGWAQINSIVHKFKIDKDKPRVEISISEVKA